MAEPCRVLQLLGPSTGGIRRHVAHLTERLRQRGWSVETAGPAGVLDGLAVALDRVVEVPARFPSPHLQGVVAARGALADMVDRFDVVHAHGLKAGWLAGSLVRRPPLVATVHNLVLAEVSGAATPVLRLLEACLPARAERTVAASRQVARRFTGLPGAGRVRTIPPVWPPPRPVRPRDQVRAELGSGPDQLLVVAVARLHPQKDLGTLVEAMGRLHRRVGGARGAIVGEGPLEVDLRRHIGQLGLSEVVTLAGAWSSSADALAAADVVVVCSRWESGPLVAWEAMQLGRPLVSTPVGAVPDVVVDGVSGRLTPVGDVGALAATLESVLSHPSTAQALGEAGRAAVGARYDETSLVARIEAVYDETIALGHKQRGRR